MNFFFSLNTTQYGNYITCLSDTFSIDEKNNSYKYMYSVIQMEDNQIVFRDGKINVDA